jgi:hypothetical protein
MVARHLLESMHLTDHDQLHYREVCAHWVPTNATNDNKAHVGLWEWPCIHFDMLPWSRRAVLGLEHGYSHNTWHQKQDAWYGNCHHLPANKMEALSSVKKTMADCLGTINMCLFWISLMMVTLSAECYCGTLRLWQAICYKRPGLLHRDVPTGCNSCSWLYIW